MFQRASVTILRY